MYVGDDGQLYNDDGSPVTQPIGGVAPDRVAAALRGRAGGGPSLGQMAAGGTPDPRSGGQTLGDIASHPLNLRQNLAAARAAEAPGLAAPSITSPSPPSVPEMAPSTPALPLPTTRKMERTGSQTTTKYTKVSPEHAANIEAQDRNFDDQIAARQDEGVRNQELAELDATAARGLAANQALRTLEQTQAITHAEEAAKKRRGEIDAQVDRMSKMKPMEYGVSKSGWSKALSFIGLALSGAGDVFSALGGQRGGATQRALEMIQADRDRHDQLERDKIVQEGKKLERLERMDDRAKAAYLEQLRLIDVRRAGTDAYIKAQLVAAKKARGMTDEEIATQKDVLLIEQSQLQHQERAKSLSDQEIASITTRQLVESSGAGVGTGPGGKPPTATQSQANEFLQVMTEEAKNIERLPPLSPQAQQILFEELALQDAAAKNPTIDFGARLLGIRQTVESRVKGTDRQAYAAYLAFLDPLVRRRSGAVASPGEIAGLARPIMPTVGDQAGDLSSKRQRRQNYLYSIAEGSNDREGWRGRIDQVYSGTSPAASGAIADPRVQRMKDLLRTNPNHPQAEAIKAKLQELGAL